MNDPESEERRLGFLYGHWPPRPPKLLQLALGLRVETYVFFHIIVKVNLQLRNVKFLVKLWMVILAAGRESASEVTHNEYSLVGSRWEDPQRSLECPTEQSLHLGLKSSVQSRFFKS